MIEHSEFGISTSLRDGSAVVAGRLAALYRHSPAMMHSIDRTGRIVEVSDYWLKVLGYRRDEILGRKSTEFLTPDSARFAIQTVLPEFMRTGVCHNVEYQMVCKDGRVLDVLLSATAQYDEDAQYDRSFAVIVDITAWNKFRDRARIVDQRYRNVVETQHELICRFDNNLVLTFVNGAYARFFKRQDLVGRSFLELVPEAHHAAIRHHVSGLRPLTPVTYEHEVHLPDGTIGWQQWTDLALSHDGETIVEYQSVGRDITELKRLEQNTRESERFLRDVIETLADGLAVFDPDGKLVLFNERYREIYKESPDLIVNGAKYEEIIREGLRRGRYGDVGPDPEAWIEAHVARFQDGNQSYEVSLAGDRYVHVNTRKTRDGHIVGIRRDITERKRLENRIHDMAMRDGLTGIANRTSFESEFVNRTQRAVERDGSLALIFLDLDNFKSVNDTYGHAAGDELLQLVAKRFKRVLREDDFAARLGGDEFVVLATSPEPGTCFEPLVRRLLECLQEPAEISEGAIFPGVSIGFAVFPDDPSDLYTLRRHADAALYEAKNAGRNTWRRYSIETRCD